MRRTWPAPHPAGLRECPHCAHTVLTYGERYRGFIHRPAGIITDPGFDKCRYCHPARRTGFEFAAFTAGINAVEDVRLYPDTEVFELYWNWRLPQTRWDNEWGKRIY